MDTEHASVAPVYADAFVTADGHLRSLLVGQKKRWNGIQADILGSVADLSKWIATIE